MRVTPPLDWILLTLYHQRCMIDKSRDLDDADLDRRRFRHRLAAIPR